MADKANHLENGDGDESPKVRVGQEYQAEIPQFIGYYRGERSADVPSPRVTKVWSPSEVLSDEQMESYVHLAKEKYGYSMEQAMGMLFWHEYDVEAASADLQNFTPLPEEMSLEDKVIFEQAFQSHGKSFRRIHSMLPDKSVGSLVKYYYSWKKGRCRTSHITRQARHFGGASMHDLTDDSEGEAASHTSSDSDFEPNGGKSIGNQQGSKKNFKQHSSASNSKGRLKPKGIYLNTDSLAMLAKGQESSTSRSDVANLRRYIQQNKQALSRAESSMQPHISMVEQMRPTEIKRGGALRWNTDETAIAIEAFHKHGRDYQLVSSMVGSKTSSQCRNFYMAYKRRYNLDQSVVKTGNSPTISPSGTGQVPRRSY